jgi:hypothetical protein
LALEADLMMIFWLSNSDDGVDWERRNQPPHHHFTQNA